MITCKILTHIPLINKKTPVKHNSAEYENFNKLVNAKIPKMNAFWGSHIFRQDFTQDSRLHDESDSWSTPYFNCMISDFFSTLNYFSFSPCFKNSQLPIH